MIVKFTLFLVLALCTHQQTTNLLSDNSTLVEGFKLDKDAVDFFSNDNWDYLRLPCKSAQNPGYVAWMPQETNWTFNNCTVAIPKSFRVGLNSDLTEGAIIESQVQETIVLDIEKDFIPGKEGFQLFIDVTTVRKNLPGNPNKLFMKIKIYVVMEDQFTDEEKKIPDLLELDEMKIPELSTPLPVIEQPRGNPQNNQTDPKPANCTNWVTKTLCGTSIIQTYKNPFSCCINSNSLYPVFTSQAPQTKVMPTYPNYQYTGCSFCGRSYF